MEGENDSSSLHILRRLWEKDMTCRTCSVTQQGKVFATEPDNPLR